MGLAASQARLLLLTAKNDALELQAQMIEQERLMLAQEQETIAQEYSDATTNTIMTARVTNGDGSTSQQTVTLDSLAKAMGSVNGGNNNGQIVCIADAMGKPIAFASARMTNGKWEMTYYDGNGRNLGRSGNSATAKLNDEGFASALQNGLNNGSYQLLLPALPEMQGEDTTALDLNTYLDTAGNIKLGDVKWERKSTNSLDTVTSRYYTEDDAAAQAKYQTAMARVNALDTRLENRLNQVETQKKAVEQEMESVKSLVQSNVERTFKYFS